MILILCFVEPNQDSLLHVQAILGFVENDRLRSVDDLTGDLFATVGGETVHDDGVTFRDVHGGAVDLIRTEHLAPLGRFVLLTHAGPDVGIDRIRTTQCFGGIARDDEIGAACTRVAHDGRIRLVTGGTGDREREAVVDGSVDPRVGHVVAVAEKRDAPAGEIAPAFDQREAVAQHLARVAEIGQAVHHRRARMGGELDQRGVREGARHDEVDPALEIARDVGDGLAFAQADEFLASYGINDNALRVAHFMAQVLHESGGLCIIQESLNYSAKRMMQVWPKRFPTIESAQPYANNPQLLANNVYGARMGNAGPDDGWKYIGRGLLQITGRDSYEKFGQRLGIDLVGQPMLAADPQWSLKIAAEEWCDKGCNALADRDDITTITKRINGGLIGFDERKAWLVKTKLVWK